MEWLWIIQLGINLIVVVALFVWWKERGTPSTGTQAMDLAIQAQQWEHDAANLRKKQEDQLRFLIQVCEQAHSILLRHGGNGPIAPASLEEQELKALRNPPAAAALQRNIPSVQELEVRKQAVRLEIPMDLRSLLRDQLT
jgi:hypothetical protein